MKKQIRTQIRAVKKQLGADRLVALSQPLVSLISANPHYHSSRIVMLYHPLWDEVDTRPLITHALSEGKRVILPTVHGDDIVPVEITADTQWITGDFGILEPVANPYSGNIDMIVIPGVAFDRHLNRLGRGRGYYDRFLPLHPDAYRLGLLFSFQLVGQIPVEPHDLPMHELLVI